VTVWDPRAVKPLDPVMLDDAAGHRLVVTVEDGLADGGIGSRIGLELSGRGPRVLVLGVPDVHIRHDDPDLILSRLGLDGPGVAAAVTAELGPAR
jgi:1-deoxy-D-xylulose-5-phosphate synthase